MSEDKPAYWPPLPARRHVCTADQPPMTREDRVAHVGEMALEWARAQAAWEDAPRADLHAVGDASRAADLALERLRAACTVALMHEVKP